MPIWPQKKAGGGLLENTIVRLGLGMKLGEQKLLGHEFGHTKNYHKFDKYLHLTSIKNLNIS